MFIFKERLLKWHNWTCKRTAILTKVKIRTAFRGKGKYIERDSHGEIRLKQSREMMGCYWIELHKKKNIQNLANLAYFCLLVEIGTWKGLEMGFNRENLKLLFGERQAMSKIRPSGATIWESWHLAQ